MKEAEEIIISKKYFELSPAERELVKDYASSEEDYEAMRWFLLSTRTAVTESEIEPSADLRKGVMAHLARKQPAPKTIWLNSVGTFLFPSEKKLYQYPGLQLAAVGLLLVGVVFFYNGNNLAPQDLAINSPESTSVEQDVLTTEQTKEEMPEQTLVQREVTEETPVDGRADQNQNKFRIPVAPAMESSEQKVLANENYEVVAAENSSVAYDEISVDEDKALEQQVNYTQVASDDVKEVAALSDGLSKSEKISGKNKDADNQYRNENAKKQNSDKTGAVSSDNESTTVTSANKADVNTGETERYNTATAGGVYGTIGYSEPSPSADLEEKETSSVFPVSETKMLKKLIFVVR